MPGQAGLAARPGPPGRNCPGATPLQGSRMQSTSGQPGNPGHDLVVTGKSCLRSLMVTSRRMMVFCTNRPSCGSNSQLRFSTTVWLMNPMPSRVGHSGSRGVISTISLNGMSWERCRTRPVWATQNTGLCNTPRTMTMGSLTMVCRSRISWAMSTILMAASPRHSSTSFCFSPRPRTT